MSTPAKHPLRIVMIISALVAVLVTAFIVPTASKLIANANLPHGKGINTVAIIGDSASSAMNSCGEQLLCYSNSWAGGSNKQVNSVVTRLARAEGHRVAVFNYAYPGDRIRDLGNQAKQAVEQKVDAVIILIGANDFCQDDVSKMTSAASYQATAKLLLTDLHAALPKAKLFVASVPDPAKVYAAGVSSKTIVKYWNTHNICASLTAKAGDSSAAVTARRAQVYERAAAFNRSLSKICAATKNCGYDGGALYSLGFTPGELSSVDHFHPSIAGQAAIAKKEWASAKKFLLSSK